MKIPANIRLSPSAQAALRKIEALRTYPVAATELAVQRVLSNLSLPDLTLVTMILADNDKGGAQ
jgi:hypothetical protein